MLARLTKYRWQYVMILPGVVLLFIFSYIPMAGIQIAFKDFHIGLTIANSPWVGLENFSFLQDGQFWLVVRNTLYIAVLKFIFGFPAPIILALLINEVRNNKVKRFVQSVSYLPHFFSWIVVAYVLQSLLTLDGGVVNQLIVDLGGDPIFFPGSTEWFRPMVLASGLWKEIGYSFPMKLELMALDVQ